MSLLPPTPQPPAPATTANTHVPPTSHSTIFAAGASSNSFAAPNSSHMQVSPDKNARKKSLSGGVVVGEGGVGSYRPVAYRTEGVRLACLVNASVTVCGEDSIYAFGGFDQYTDEVFNHVLKLDLHTFTWTLVDNYGDIPSVRMGHTTTYWRDDKLIIFGGENEQRVFLSDVYIFDIPSATWSQPVLSGHPPCGRSRHAVVLHDDKLFILGGIHNNPVAQPSDYDPDDEVEYSPQEVLDDICYLDLKTMTWSRSWKWVARFDHQAWVREGKLWIFGGMGKEMDRTGELISLDLSHPVFARTEIKQIGYATRPSRVMSEATTGQGRVLRSHRSYGPNSPRPLFNPRRNTPPPKPNVVPAATSSIRFLWGRDIPSEAHGTHFHHLCGSTLLDFVTFANTIRSSETGLSALDLREMTWRKIADGTDMLGGANWRWHYLAIAPNSTMAYLLGCPTDNDDIGEGEEYLSDVLPIDLTQFGMHLDLQPGEKPVDGMLGWDLGKVFDTDDSGSDFIIRAMKDEAAEGDEWDVEGMWGRNMIGSPTSDGQQREDDDLPPENVMGPPIRCHKLILLSRWRHFTSLYNARMREFHRGRLYLPEPYTVVRAFLYYLYTDSIAKSSYCPDISTVAGMLVMANLYDISRLRTLCLNRLYNELDVESAAVVWERAGVAGEEALRKKAAGFVLTYWGRVVRTRGFRRLSRRSLMELCEEVVPGSLREDEGDEDEEMS
ncbi:galactose oxidase [Wilcoxina mikolae CBS 423.85]|nr:galactose oxidase [Wilcoxina mikolae CBS 423.85]